MKKINRLSLDESLKKLDLMSSEEYKNLTGGEVSGITIPPPGNPTRTMKPITISSPPPTFPVTVVPKISGPPTVGVTVKF